MLKMQLFSRLSPAQIFLAVYVLILLVLVVVTSPDLLRLGDLGPGNAVLLLVLVIGGPLLPAYLISRAIEMQQSRRATPPPATPVYRAAAPPPAGVPVYKAVAVPQPPPAAEPALVVSPITVAAPEPELVEPNEIVPPPPPPKIEPKVEAPICESPPPEPAIEEVIVRAPEPAAPPPAFEEPAGDYVLRLHNVDIATSAGLREFIRRNPAIKILLLCNTDGDIQLNVRLESAMPLVAALADKFRGCQVSRTGRIVLIQRR